MTIDEELAKLEAEARKSNLEIKQLKCECTKEFRKSRAHILYEIGGEWFAWYSKTKIEPDGLSSEKIIDEEKERMRKMYNSLPLCPECKIGRLINEGEFWECDNSDCGAHVKVYTQQG